MPATLPEVVGCARARRPHRRVRRIRGGERPVRGPAGGPGRAALPGPGGCQVHLRHRCLPAGQRRRAARTDPRAGWPPRWPGSWVRSPPTASTARSTRPAPRVAWLCRWGLLDRAEDARPQWAAAVPDAGGVDVRARAERPGGPVVATATPVASMDGHRPGHASRPMWSGPRSRVWPPRWPCWPGRRPVDLGGPLVRLQVDGGLTGSAVLMQTQADLLQLPGRGGRRPPTPRPLGVGALARLGAGEGRDLADVVRPVTPGARFEPSITAAEAAERLGRFEAAVGRIPDRAGRAGPVNGDGGLRRGRDRRRGGRHGHRPPAGPLPTLAPWCWSGPTMWAAGRRRPTRPSCTPGSTPSPARLESRLVRRGHGLLAEYAAGVGDRPGADRRPAGGVGRGAGGPTGRRGGQGPRQRLPPGPPHRRR